MSDKVKSNKSGLRSTSSINNISPYRAITGEFRKDSMQEKWKVSEKAEKYKT